MAGGFKVILSYWEADNAKDGRVDDPAACDAMWNTVVAAYGKNPRVYFEPMNEPFGYSLDEWVSLTSSWLAQHSDVPRGRVVISGTGYNDNVTGVGAAPELRGHAAVAALLRLLGLRRDRGRLAGEPAAADRRRTAGARSSTRPAHR